MQEVLQEKTIAEKRKNTCDEIDIAKMEVILTQSQLKKNLEHISNILSQIKKLKKIIFYLFYLKLNWLNDNYNENQLKVAKRRLKDCSSLYEKTILERKILKLKLKQAQKKLSKKQKSIIRFDKKYYSKNQ